jgi:hypothetical protein
LPTLPFRGLFLLNLLARLTIVRIQDLAGVPLILPSYAQQLSFNTKQAVAVGRHGDPCHIRANVG